MSGDKRPSSQRKSKLGQESDSPISQRVSDHDAMDDDGVLDEVTKAQKKNLKNQNLKMMHKEKQHHMELYNDESPFVHMEIFKDVVGLTREQLERVKEGKKAKKIPKNQPCNVTVGAKFTRT